jgi:hypothetical protein
VIGIGYLEKLLEMIGGLPRLMNEVTIGSGATSSLESPASLLLPLSSPLVVIVTHKGHRFDPLLLLLAPSLHLCLLS